ncbi:hypothetical protein L596_007429 [Steinernema carpocapsae]|uniref:C2H2-type domain-containing protein n=1 Tax=Steinernema carpocapsae TaxID=34508 RepID=A0A4U5P9N7_STECR|nr:hypothetical protein L596_007429 [Steinernema carpocapsae]
MLGGARLSCILVAALYRSPSTQMLVNGKPKKKEGEEDEDSLEAQARNMSVNNPIRRWLQKRALPTCLHCIDCGEKFNEKPAYDIHVVKHQILDICYQIQETEDIRFEMQLMERRPTDEDGEASDHGSRDNNDDEGLSKQLNGETNLYSPPVKRVRLTRTLSDSSSEGEYDYSPGSSAFSPALRENIPKSIGEVPGFHESSVSDSDDEMSRSSGREALKLLADVSAVQTPPAIPEKTNGIASGTSPSSSPVNRPPSLFDSPKTQKVFDVLGATITRNSYNPGVNGQENSGTYTYAPIARKSVNDQ